MSRLPVITAFGGISAAGRSGGYHAFQRLIFERLATAEQTEVLSSLAALQGPAADASDRTEPQRRADPDSAARHPVNSQQAEALLADTLVRRLPANRIQHQQGVAADSAATVQFTVRNLDMPATVPDNWHCTPLDRTRTRVTVAASALRLPVSETARVQTAGQLPNAFDPAHWYPARNHPRALQMSIFGASDCLGMLGIPWQTLADQVAPEQVAVYASSAMSQLDDNGFGGMLRFPHQGRRITSKQCPLGFGQMPADFINAYVLGSVGRTGGMLGACASFLYNLSLGVQDIRSGRARIALVGAAEAPLVAEVFEGYRAMGALAEDSALAKLDGSDAPDWRRAVRPFAENCGFTLAESAQFFLLMDDELALQCGAPILAAVPDVFIHADGIKKSISAPGAGNYLTLARAAALARQLLGEQALQRHSFVSAHGTSTPQNRRTESDVLNRVAQAFAIEQWPVNAIKCYLGHSLASAAGDQLMAMLGTFASGWLPGIVTSGAIAADVHRSHLDFALDHRQLEQPACGFINSKGFGGNNASALVLAPELTLRLLAQRHGNKAVQQWRHQDEVRAQASSAYQQQIIAGSALPTYRFDDGVMDTQQISINDRQITLPGFAQPVRLDDDVTLADFALPPDADDAPSE